MKSFFSMKQGCILLGLAVAWPSVAVAEIRSIQEILRQNHPLQEDGSGRGAKLAQTIEEHNKKKPSSWDEDIKRFKGKPSLEMLKGVHEYINQRIRYADDLFNAYLSPYQAFTQGGDCEDYAIAKLLLLRESGFPEESLRIVTLAPTRLTSPYHVILVAQWENRLYVLDSPNRAQSKDVVLLENYRDGDRPVVWAAWSGGFSSSDSTLNKQAAGSSYTGLLLPRRFKYAKLVGPEDRLILVAADLKVITRRERPLNQAEIVKLRNLRAYFNEPTSSNARLISSYEAKKLDVFRRLRN